jgi:hypothetical protein
MRSPTAKTFWMLAVVALAALGAEFYIGFALGFAPGWANGWPGGLSIYRVWSAGMTAILFVIEVTVGVGLGALIGLLMCQFPAGRRHAWLIFGVWLVACTAVAVLNCSRFYRDVYASTLQMWPNGYGVGR